MNILSMLLHSCDKATLLAERAGHNPLGPMESFRLWVHMRICGGCRTFEKQSKILDDCLQKRVAAETDTTELQQRILSRTAQK